MASLYQNAIEAIQLGVEDYSANDPRRASSAVRNFYSGTLNLAKETLARTVPLADPRLVIAARIKLVPDGAGGVVPEPDGANTLDFSNIGKRLKDFGVDVEMAAMHALNRIRNDIEHSENPHSPDVVREAIATAFPVVSQLFAALEENPVDELGNETWQRMLDVKAMHDRELAACTGSFGAVDWQSSYLASTVRRCPGCNSVLVEIVPQSVGVSDFQSISARCRQCGEDIDAETLVTHSLSERLSFEIYQGAKGDAETPLHTCPECALETYATLVDDDGNEVSGCLWCGCRLGDCAVCGEGLTPETVHWDNTSLCSYHGAMMEKDD